jgi:restriction system protein
MRGYVWEDYLVQVCRTLGAKVERTGKSGDQGVDLIVEFGTRRIAVQAKGFDDEYGVNNEAVQEAYTGKACYKCDACAVITNTRFMKSATQSAIATGCILIGEDEFPDFVMGKIEL